MSDESKWLTMGDAVAASDLEELNWHLSRASHVPMESSQIGVARFFRWHTEARAQRERADRAERRVAEHLPMKEHAERRVAEWVEAHRLMKESRDDADRTTRMYRDRLTSLTAQLREAVEVGQQIDTLLSTTLSGGTNVAKLQRLRDRLAAVACTLEVPGD